MGWPGANWLTSALSSSQNRSFSRKSHTFLPKIFFRKMSSSGAKDKPELQFPFLQDEETVATLLECKTLFILRGLPGSGKSTLARAIVDRYRDGTKMVSADAYKITPGGRGDFSEEYKRLDEDLAAYCRRDVRVLVLDDTNHERERLEQLFDLADQYQYQVVLVEPKTAWRLDCAQLKEKNQWQLSADELKKLKPGLEKDFLPLYFGWFLTKKSSESLRKAGQAFLEELGNHKAFKKELRHCRWPGMGGRSGDCRCPLAEGRLGVARHSGGGTGRPLSSLYPSSPHPTPHGDHGPCLLGRWWGWEDMRPCFHLAFSSRAIFLK